MRLLVVLFIALIYSFNVDIVCSQNSKIGKQTIDLSIAELEHNEMQKQDLLSKQEIIKQKEEVKKRQEKIENKQIKKEVKQQYKQAQKNAKIAKREQQKNNILNQKAKEKITPLKGDNKKTNATNKISPSDKKTKIKQSKKMATSKQKKVIKQAEKMSFIDDDAILDIIDNQIAQVSYKAIRVNTKNKGVPVQCLPNNKSTTATTQQATKAEYKDSPEVANRKKNLKNNILASLKANDISADLIDKIYKNLTHIQSTTKANDNYIKKTNADFINNYNIPTRTKSGLIYKKLYKKDLQVVEDVFYVEPEAVLTIWAMETNYGNFIGNYNAFNALYSACMNAKTLARIEYFENNLVMLAKLVDYGYFKPDVLSSFDGGLGGCQFMPDSFYKYAVAFDGGKADIINNNKDVFASIGNYLYNTGWRHYQGVLTEVVLPDDFDMCLTGLNTSKSVEEWKKLGVKLNDSRIGAQFFENDDAKASIVITDINNNDIDFSDKRAFIVYDNLKVLLGYNQNISYGITAGLIYTSLLENN